MKKQTTIWRDIHKSIVENDFSIFLNYYNFDIKNNNISTDLNEIQCYGIVLRPCSTSEIKKTKFTKLRNEIIFYSNPSKSDVKELIRHFKNLVSHPENIKIATIKGKPYYRVYDYKFGKPRKDSMKGVVSVDLWKNFVKQIMKKIK